MRTYDNVPVDNMTEYMTETVLKVTGKFAARPSARHVHNGRRVPMVDSTGAQHAREAIETHTPVPPAVADATSQYGREYVRQLDDVASAILRADKSTRPERSYTSADRRSWRGEDVAPLKPGRTLERGGMNLPAGMGRMHGRPPSSRVNPGRPPRRRIQTAMGTVAVSPDARFRA